MRLLGTTAEEAAINEHCIYEVLWSADSVAAADETLQESSTAAKSAAAFSLRQGQAARSIAATLSTLQHVSSAGVHGIAVAESSATQDVCGHSAAAAFLRCAARELPEAFASAAMASSRMPGSGSRGARVELDCAAPVMTMGDLQGSSMGEGALWRPRLARSTACQAPGETSQAEPC